jgi:GR25 family glycosyltransferase involved in LPS biosynthesis
MSDEGLTWTWANGNTEHTVCPKTNLKHFPYTSNDLRTKIGCSMSHYLLWKKAMTFTEPTLILEHDAVFVRSLPEDFKVNYICQINDPNGCTPRGSKWSQTMQRRGAGIFEKTWVREEHERDIPDGLAGNSAYIVTPSAARELVNTMQALGVWPNDAMICKQLFPKLEELYPFVTVVKQTQSTTVG